MKGTWVTAVINTLSCEPPWALTDPWLQDSHPTPRPQRHRAILRFTAGVPHSPTSWAGLGPATSSRKRKAICMKCQPSHQMFDRDRLPHPASWPNSSCLSTQMFWRTAENLRKPGQAHTAEGRWYSGVLQGAKLPLISLHHTAQPTPRARPVPGPSSFPPESYLDLTQHLVLGLLEEGWSAWWAGVRETGRGWGKVVVWRPLSPWSWDWLEEAVVPILTVWKFQNHISICLFPLTDPRPCLSVFWQTCAHIGGGGDVRRAYSLLWSLVECYRLYDHCHLSRHVSPLAAKRVACSCVCHWQAPPCF